MQKPLFVHNHLSMYKKCCCHAFVLFKGTFLRNKHLRHYYSTLFFCNLGLDHVRVNSSYIINMYVLLKKNSNYKYICFKILITFLSKTSKVPSQLIITMWQQDKFNCRLGATHASHFDMHITTVNSKHTRHLFCYVLHSGLKMEK